MSDKKIGKSFSLTQSEIDRVEARTAHHKFKHRNEYLLALMEADIALDLRKTIVEGLVVLRTELTDKNQRTPAGFMLNEDPEKKTFEPNSRPPRPSSLLSRSKPPLADEDAASA